MQLLEAGARVRSMNEPFELGGRQYSAGAYVVATGGISGARLRDIAAATGIHFVAGNPGGASTTVRRPRIGLHKSWVASMDAGWITYIFDTYSISYDLVTNAEIKAGRLDERFDVIVLADQRASQIVDGHRKGTIPPDYVGGIGDEGVIALRDFVRGGGKLVTNNGSSGFWMISLGDRM